MVRQKNTNSKWLKQVMHIITMRQLKRFGNDDRIKRNCIENQKWKFSLLPCNNSSVITLNSHFLWFQQFLAHMSIESSCPCNAQKVVTESPNASSYEAANYMKTNRDQNNKVTVSSSDAQAWICYKVFLLKKNFINKYLTNKANDSTGSSVSPSSFRIDFDKQKSAISATA